MPITDSKSQEETVSDPNSLLYECYFSDGETSEDSDGLIWKEILREGEWAYSPGPNQKPVPIPLKVVSGYSNDPNEIGMQDLVDAYNDEAIEHVTVPLSHSDRPDENTGYVRGLKVQEREGSQYLLAGLEITEPDIKGKIERKSIANTSAGLLKQYIHKQSGKKYPLALGHVALTNKPWITGNRPFGVAAEFSEDQIIPVVEEEREDKTFRQTTREEASRHIAARADALGMPLPQSWLQTHTGTNDANVVWSENGANNGAEVSHKHKEENMAEEATVTDETPVNPPSSAPEVTQEQIDLIKQQLSEEFKADLEAKQAKIDEYSEKLSTQAQTVRQMEVDRRISELEGMGFSEAPGLLAEIRKIYLADSGESTLNFSEEQDGKEVEVSLSVSDAIDRFISALPTDDGKVVLSQQTNELENHSEPESKPLSFEDKPLEERIEALAKGVGAEYIPEKEGDS